MRLRILIGLLVLATVPFLVHAIRSADAHVRVARQLVRAPRVRQTTDNQLTSASSRAKTALTVTPSFAGITVNSTSDVVNGSDGLCTLREAITAANSDVASGGTPGECAAGNGDDTITITATGTINLASALPSISTNLSVSGPGANLLTVQRSTAGGTPNFRVFTVSPGVNAGIDNLAISNGRTADGVGPIFLGDFGGGILNAGTLTLDSVAITNNRTGNGSVSGGHGGGIYNSGTLTISRSTISGNRTGDGGNGGLGGGISNGGMLNVINTTIAANQTGNGGSPPNAGAGGSGGGVYVSASGTLNLTNSTVSGNTTGNGATSLSPSGGGIHNLGTTNFRNTIIANNAVGTGGSGPDLSGTFNSQDYNLVETATGSTIGGAIGHNIIGIDPKLGALSFNGGSTQTLSPLPGSAAIEAGDNCVITNSCSPSVGTAITTDQRGNSFSRAADGNGDGVATVDIGAYEVQAIIVTNTNDSGGGSLRQAITDANANSGTDAINFQGGLSGSITLVTALPTLSTSMALNGPGAAQITVQRSSAGGTPNFRLFTVSGATVSISGLTAANGRGADAVSVGTSGVGGAGFFIASDATLNLADVVISGNRTGDGGGGAGVGGGSGGAIQNFGTLTVTNSSIRNNVTGFGGNNTGQGGSGGGGGAIMNFGTALIVNSTISDNQTGAGGNGGTGGAAISGGSGGGGGGIVNATNLTLINSTVSNNTTGNGGTSGGGVTSRGGLGGGISNSGTLTLINSTVAANHTGAGGSGGAGGDGGGIWNQSSFTVNAKNTIIAANAVGSGGVGPDFSGTLNSQDYNLIGNTSGVSFTGATTHNITNQDAGLAVLGNYGGPTMTHALLPGSPAIDAGNNALAVNQNNVALTTDQRGAGFARIVNATVDIGAFESRGFSISATSGTPQSATITTNFNAPLVATVTSTFGEPVAGGRVTFTAPSTGASGTFPPAGASAVVTLTAGGVATSPTFKANSLAGSYIVIAGGSGISVPASFSLTNLQAPTATAVISSLNPSSIGQAVTFTASVTSFAGIPTGTVQFKDNGSNLGAPQSLNSGGQASVTTSSLTLGIHTITAEYGGDANFLSSVGTLAGGQTVGAILSFSAQNYMTNENGLAAMITVNRTGDVSSTPTVGFATSDTAGLANCGVASGAASERCDYVTSIGRVSFASGESSKSFTIPLVDDVLVEGNEVFTVSLFGSTNAQLGSPSTATVTILDNDSSPSSTNPIDGVDFFVRQQYLDILGRQPDQTGFQNWVNTLSGCPNGGFGEPPTSNCDRLHVAAGFFQSDEFLNRGYWAFRFYMVGFNQRPTYAQFIPDMSQVGGPKSPAEEEASKVAFADAFVQRPEFLSRYGGLSGQALADGLTQTGGLPPYTVTTGQTNGQILRAIAERQTSLDKFLTEGTVSILYFGFQRRDPDAIGYQNNVDTLNANPNNLRHLIFIFIYSTEYRGRFGPP